MKRKSYFAANDADSLHICEKLRGGHPAAVVTRSGRLYRGTRADALKDEAAIAVITASGVLRRTRHGMTRGQTFRAIMDLARS